MSEHKANIEGRIQTNKDMINPCETLIFMGLVSFDKTKNFKVESLVRNGESIEDKINTMRKDMECFVPKQHLDSVTFSTRMLLTRDSKYYQPIAVMWEYNPELEES